jgi:hypothetical protein
MGEATIATPDPPWTIRGVNLAMHPLASSQIATMGRWRLLSCPLFCDNSPLNCDNALLLLLLLLFHNAMAFLTREFCFFVSCQKMIENSHKKDWH